MELRYRNSWDSLYQFKIHCHLKKITGMCLKYWRTGVIFLLGFLGRFIISFQETLRTWTLVLFVFVLFRCSSHDLMIEKGRHLNIERNYRCCRYCLSRNVYVVENEVHFLLYCPLYDNLRHSFFRSEWLNSIPCEQTFVLIMCDKRQEGLF